MDFGKHRQRERERERAHPSGQPSFGQRDRTQSLEPFDFAPFDFAVRLRLRIAPFNFAVRLRIAPRLHPSTSLANPEPFDFAPFDFTVRLWLRIAPRSHLSTSLANPKPRSCIWLRRDLTPGSHWDGTDRIEIAIEKWLGFDEFDRIWWIFFCWVLFLCLSIEKWYYIFV